MRVKSRFRLRQKVLIHSRRSALFVGNELRKFFISEEGKSPYGALLP